MNPTSDKALKRFDTGTGIESSQVVVTRPVPQWLDSGGAARGRSLASYLEIPFMHKWLIAACVIGAVILAWLLILLLPRGYESEAKLLVKVGRENVALDPTATHGPNFVALQKTQEEEIASVLQVLNSREVAEQVVDILGAEAVMDGHLPSDSGGSGAKRKQVIPAGITDALSTAKNTANEWLYQTLLFMGIKDEISNRELAVRQLMQTVEIESPKKSAVVTVNATSGSPQMAQAIVKQITDEFLEEHMDGAYTNGSYEFFQAQSDEVEARVDQLVAERADFLEEHKIVSIEQKRELLGSQIKGIDRDLAIATGQLEKAEAEARDLEVKLHGTEDEVVSAKTEGLDATWNGMRQQLYLLEVEEERLASTLTAEHPRLKRLRTQLDGAREIMGQFASERVDESKAPNPIKLGLLRELQATETLVVGLESMIQEQKKQRAELESQVEVLPDKESRLTQLDRDIAMETSSLGLLRQKMEEARVIEDLHENEFSNIHVFQPATFVERAASPNKKLLGIGMVFLGLMAGVALSYVKEGTSAVLRTSEDVELELGQSVAASIPRLKNMRTNRFRPRQDYRVQCQKMLAEILMMQHRSHRARGRSVGIIGVEPGAGASTLAANLALTSDVDCKLKTVLVDADSRRRSVSRMFGLDGTPGLVELLSGSASHDECLQKLDNGEVELIASSGDAKPEVMASSAPEIVQALEAYMQDCDLLVVDLPAASQPDQAVALAQHLDCIVVVAESEKTKSAEAERLLNRLYLSNTEVIGVVLTKTRSYLPWFVRPFVPANA